MNWSVQIDKPNTTASASSVGPDNLTSDEKHEAVASTSAQNESSTATPWAEVSPWVSSSRAPQERSQGWYPRYRLAAAISDFMAVSVAAFSSVHFLYAPMQTTGGLVRLPYLWLAALIVVLWVSALGLASSRSRGSVGWGQDEYRLVLSTSLYLFAGLAIASYGLKSDLSRALFVTVLPLGITLLLIGRWLLRKCLHRFRAAGRAVTRTVAIGTEESVLRVIHDTLRNRGIGYRVDAVCPVGGSTIKLRAQHPAVAIITRGDLEEAIKQHTYRAVIVAEGVGSQEGRELAWLMENRPIELMFLPRLIDVSGPRLLVKSVEGLSLVHVDLPKFTGWRQVLKRTFDILFSVFALILLSPVLAVIALLIKRDDGGPFMFRQQRIGRNGEPFIIHKFRTMCTDAEAKVDALIAANGGRALLFKVEDDPRITKIGKVLRKYSLDELPQFWTVLRGGMSIVGPRPQVAREVAEYSDVHHRRLLIKPGITGLWQVNGRSQLSPEESIRLDLRYVENWSLMGDVSIVMKTVAVVLRREGAY